jgi:hypothetical protein
MVTAYKIPEKYISHTRVLQLQYHLDLHRK